MEHPSLVEEYGLEIAIKLAQDRAKKPSTTTEEGKRLAACLDMRRTRLVQKFKDSPLESFLNNIEVAEVIKLGNQPERKSRNDIGKPHKRRTNN